MRIQAAKLLLHNNSYPLPSHADLNITYLGFTESGLYFSLVYVTWKAVIIKSLPQYFNKESESMFMAWIEKQKSFQNNTTLFWKDLFDFVHTYNNLLYISQVNVFLTTLQQIWSLVSINTWVNLSPMEILKCNIKRIKKDQGKLWVILEKDKQTNHYLADSWCISIVQAMGISEVYVDFILFDGVHFSHAGKSRIIVNAYS